LSSILQPELEADIKNSEICGKPELDIRASLAIFIMLSFTTVTAITINATTAKVSNSISQRSYNVISNVTVDNKCIGPQTEGPKRKLAVFAQ